MTSEVLVLLVTWVAGRSSRAQVGGDIVARRALVVADMLGVSKRIGGELLRMMMRMMMTK